MVPILGSSRGDSMASKIGFCLENVQETGYRNTANDWVDSRI